LGVVGIQPTMKLHQLAEVTKPRSHRTKGSKGEGLLGSWGEGLVLSHHNQTQDVILRYNRGSGILESLGRQQKQHEKPTLQHGHIRHPTANVCPPPARSEMPVCAGIVGTSPKQVSTGSLVAAVWASSTIMSNVDWAVRRREGRVEAGQARAERDVNNVTVNTQYPAGAGERH